MGDTAAETNSFLVGSSPLEPPQRQELLDRGYARVPDAAKLEWDDGDMGRSHTEALGET